MPSPGSDSTSNQEVAGAAEGSREPRDRRTWTEEEDQALIDAVRRFGSTRGRDSAWTEISMAVGSNRTNKDCRKRWFHSLDPLLRKGKWSSQEDEALKRLHGQLGSQWKKIALQIPGRKDDQCSKRWYDVLDPDLTPKQPWSSLEDALLLQLHGQHGSRWTTIAEHLPGRSPLACRNRSRKYLELSGKGAGHRRRSTSQRGGAPSNPYVPRPQPPDDSPSFASPIGSLTVDSQAGPSSSSESGAKGDTPAGWELPEGVAPTFDFSTMLSGYPSAARHPATDGQNFSGQSRGIFGEGSGVGGGFTAAEGLSDHMDSIWPDVLGGGGALSPRQDEQGGDVTMESGAEVGSGSAGDAFAHWLSSFSNSYLSPNSTLTDNPGSSTSQPPTDIGQSTSLANQAVDRDASVSAAPTAPDVPINNVWGLLLALDTQQSSVYVETKFMRQLLADAASGRGPGSSRN